MLKTEKRKLKQEGKKTKINKNDHISASRAAGG